jgi:hypothetical protein
VLAAVEMVPVPSVAEIESRKEGFERRTWEDYRKEFEQTWRTRQEMIEAIPEEERQDFEDTQTWEWMEQDEKDRQALHARIAENSRRLNEEMRAMKANQHRTGLALSRISPASAFQLVALEVAGTGLGLSDRYIDSMQEYNNRFSQFVEEQGGNRMTIRIGHGDDDEEGEDDEEEAGGLMDQGKPLDLREMPRYQPPVLAAGAAVAPTIPDLGLLGVLIAVCFAVAFTAFLRYDVRPA